MKEYHGTKTKESIRDLWQTPKWLFDYYNKRFNFTCDFAASLDNALCEHYFSEPDENGEGGALGCSPQDGCLDGSGAVWCNPPYSNITPWVQKCYKMAEVTGKVFVMLIPADTSAKWFKLAFENCSECHLISGRLSFVNADTQKPVNGNNKGSVVFIFDPHSPMRSQVCLLDRDKIKAQ